MLKNKESNDVCIIASSPLNQQLWTFEVFRYRK